MSVLSEPKVELCDWFLNKERKEEWFLNKRRKEEWLFDEQKEKQETGFIETFRNSNFNNFRSCSSHDLNKRYVFKLFKENRSKSDGYLIYSKVIKKRRFCCSKSFSSSRVRATSLDYLNSNDEFNLENKDAKNKSVIQNLPNSEKVCELSYNRGTFQNTGKFENGLTFTESISRNDGNILGNKHLTSLKANTLKNEKNRNKNAKDENEDKKIAITNDDINLSTESNILTNEDNCANKDGVILENSQNFGFINSDDSKNCQTITIKNSDNSENFQNLANLKSNILENCQNDAIINNEILTNWPNHATSSTINNAKENVEKIDGCDGILSCSSSLDIPSYKLSINSHFKTENFCNNDKLRTVLKSKIDQTQENIFRNDSLKLKTKSEDSKSLSVSRTSSKNQVHGKFQTPPSSCKRVQDCTEFEMILHVIPQKILKEFIESNEIHSVRKGCDTLITYVENLKKPKSISPFLENLLSFFNTFYDHSDFAVATINLRLIKVLFEKLSTEDVEKNLYPILNSILLNYIDERYVVRSDAANSYSLLNRKTTPDTVTQVLCSFVRHRSSKVREGALNLITSSLLQYPSDLFDLVFIYTEIIRALTDERKRVRQAGLECIATVAQNLGNAKIVALMSEVSFLEETPAGKGVSAAVQNRLSRRILPRLTNDGLIKYSISPATFDRNRIGGCSFNGVDVDWILAASGSLSRGSIYEMSKTPKFKAQNLMGKELSNSLPPVLTTSGKR